MAPPSTLREKLLALGILLTILGLTGLSPIGEHQTLRIAAGISLVTGFVMYRAFFFVGAWDRNGLIKAIHKSPNGSFWLWLATIILWLGILPMVGLWLYRQLPARH